MNEVELDKLSDIFFNEAPWGYALNFEDEKPVTSKGFTVGGTCSFGSKVVTIYDPLHESYEHSLILVLHEIAHGRVNDHHTEKWAKEFIRMMEKYKVDKMYFASEFPMGPNLFKWVTG